MSAANFRIFPTYAALLLALGAPLLSGCNKIGGVTEQEHVQKAKDFQAKGDLRASVIELKNALQKNPNNAEVRLLLGQVYVSAGQGFDAEKELLKARELGVNEETIKVPLGQAFLLQENYMRVLNEIKPGSNTSAKNKAKILQIQGDAQIGLRRFEDGCRLFQQAFEADAANVQAHLGLAKCALAKRDFDGARAKLDAAFKLDEKNDGTWGLLGDLERVRNNLSAAESAYANATKLNPKNIEAFLSLASIHLGAGKLDAARAEVDAARKVAPKNALAMYTDALLNYRQGKYAESRDILQELLRGVPNYMPGVLLSGMVAYSLGSYEQAETSLSRFVQQHPASPFARKMLAVILLKQNQANHALETLQPLLATPSQDSQLFGLAGEVYLQNKNPQKATEYFEKAVASNPKNAAIRTQLGVSRLAAGENAQAVIDLEAAADLDPKQHKADTLLVLTYLNSREFDKALDAIRALEKKLPDNALIHNLAGTAYVGKQEFEKARASFDKALALQPNNSEATMNLAQIDLYDKQPQAARKRFEDILKKDKNNLQALLALARLAGQNNQENEMVGWLERAAKTSASALQPRVLLARYYLQKNQAQKALALAHEAQTSAPTNLDTLDLLGATQLAADEKDNALVTYTKMVGLTPNNPAAHFKLASVQAALQNLPEAGASLNKALKLKADYLDAQLALATLDTRMGKQNEALAIAHDVQRQLPKSPAGFALEGDVLMTQKQFPQAIKAYEAAYILAKTGPLVTKIHTAYTRSGKVKEADARVLQWLKEHPDDLVTRFYLAEAYAAERQPKLAIQQYETVLQKETNNVLALNNLAWLYYQEKDARAINTAEQAYKLKPSSAPVADTLGWILLDQGKISRAVEIFKKAVALAPDNPEIGYHYAVALAKAGDKARARQQLEQLLASNKSFGQRDAAKALLKQM